jgi:cysteine desulfurase family protein
MNEIYADHAATTFPRPPAVAAAMTSYLTDIGCSPGRGGYRRALDAARLVYEARESLAGFFNAPKPEQVIFTPSITYSLNLVLKGLLKAGDHVITSSMEHNAVVRPLYRLQKERGVQVEYLRCAPDGTLDPGQVRDALRPKTRLVVLTHASNVTGTLLPVYEVGEMLSGSEVFYAVDTAQTAGTETVDFAGLHCDYLLFTGHKGLLGPPGLGGLVISGRAVAPTSPLVEGGTGSRSEQEEQPDFLPDKFESGTQNVPGIAGLAAGISFLRGIGQKQVRNHKKRLTAAFLDGLKEIEGVTTYGPADAGAATAAVAVNISGFDNGDLSFTLEQVYGIMTRSGLHCAPLAHRTIGSFPKGTLRFSFGYSNTETDIAGILRAIKEIALNKGF